MIAKKNVLTIFMLGLLIGCLIGGLIGKIYNRKGKTTAIEIKESALGKLYPGSVSLRILKDMRALTLLSSNDISASKSLLIQDLDVNISSLSMLSHEVELEQFDRKTLEEGSLFLETVKNNGTPHANQ